MTTLTDVESVPIRVDRVRLEQALRNVLINAISYSPPYGVVDVIGRFDAARPGSTATVTIEVLDRGPGIPAEEVDLVFEPFVRGSGARGPGTGLGLSAARAAIEAHRGVLTVAPRADGGACFSMRVPS
ncbi:MAG: ATP-binding protein [Chloroflexi bacterium]|nr:ATP-binding protein [Chloroflexota bacterium]